MVVCRWDTNITDFIDYENPGWQNYVLNIIKHHGKRHGPTGIDYFVFTKSRYDTDSHTHE